MAFSGILFEMKFWVRYLLPTKYVAVWYPSPAPVIDREQAEGTRHADDIKDSSKGHLRDLCNALMRMLKLAECSSKDTVFDLGCGDGRVLVAAGKLGAKAVGYELDAQLCQQAEETIRHEGLEEQCRVVRADAGTADMTSATIVALYLSDRGNRELINRIKPTLQPGTRVVSNFFSIQGWEKQHVKTCTADPTTGPIHLYVYRDF